LHDLTYYEQPLTGASVLQLHWHDRSRDVTETIEESYTRGPDLVATYAQPSNHTVRPQVYWRALIDESKRQFGVDLIVSMQTSLLASVPATDCVSMYPARQCIVMRPDLSLEHLDCMTCPDWTAVQSPAVIIRHREFDLDLTAMVHPSDWTTTKIRASEDQYMQVRFDLFDESLEKGVIRRGRLRAALLPRRDAQARLVELFEQFAALEPPLTT
jgi:hypothetical protein